MRRAACHALLALALASPPGAAQAGDVKVEWDPDLAFEWDRANYERELGALVQDGLAAASGFLGFGRDAPLSVRVLTRARYEARFGTQAVWSQGARYSRGAIFVNGGNRLDAHMARLLRHEMVHAVLDHAGTGHQLPTWLNEGLAERVGSPRPLDTTEVQELEVALESHALTPLPRGGPLTRFGYLQSRAAVPFLEQKLGREPLLAVVRRTLDGRGFERALADETGWTQQKVEDEFRYWVDHLQ